MKKLIATLLPIAPLVEAFAVPPYFSPKYEPGDLTIPFVQGLFLIVLIYHGIANKQKLALNPPSLIILLVGLLSAALFGSSFHSLSFIATLLLSYVLVFQDQDRTQTVEMIKRFAVVIFVLSISIWMVRLGWKGGDLIAARSGQGIYSANALFNLLLLGFVCYVLASDRRRDWIWLLALLMISLIFISRSAIVIAAVLLLLWSLIYLGRKKEVLPTLAGIVAAIAGVFAFAGELLDVFITRFGLFGKNIELISALERLYAIQVASQRGIIWERAIDLIEKYPLFGIGLGEFVNYGSRSSAHNILLNNLAELGLLFGSVVSAIFVLPFFFFHKVSQGRDLLFVQAIYFCFLIQTLSAGQKLIQNTGYVSAFFLFFFFAVLSLISSQNAQPAHTQSTERVRTATASWR